MISVIEGTTPPQGEYNILIHANTSKGKAKRDFKIVSGDKLALTPPMGWNSWNKFACNLNETVIKQTVDELIKTGLR